MPNTAHESMLKERPQNLVERLKLGHESYRNLLRGGDVSAISFFRGRPADASPETVRPKVGFLVLSDDQAILPTAIFAQDQREVFVEYFAAPEATKAEISERIARLVAETGVALVVVMALVQRPRRALFEWLSAQRRKEQDLAALRNAVLDARDASVAISNGSPFVRQAVESRELAIVEAIYDPSTLEAHLDLGQVLKDPE